MDLEEIFAAVEDVEDEGLRDLRAHIDQLIEKRRLAAESPGQIDRMIEDYQATLGRAGGDPWVEPTSPLDSWPLGAVVTHGGSLWESEKHLNMSEPGVDGWQEVEGS